MHCIPVSSACFITADRHFVFIHPLPSGPGSAASELTSTNCHHFIFTIARLNVQENRHAELGISRSRPEFVTPALDRVHGKNIHFLVFLVQAPLV